MTDSGRFPDTENTRAQLALLAEVAHRLNLLESPGELCDYLCHQVKAIIGKGYVLVSLADESGQSVSIKAIAGFEDQGLLNAAIRALGADPRGMHFEGKDATEAELQVFRSGKLTLVREGIYTMLTRRFPKAACSIVEKLLGVKYVYSVGFMHNSRYLGGLTILTAASEPVEANRGLIEAVMAQCAVILDRMFAQDLLRKSESRLRAIYESTSVGLAFGDLAGRFLDIHPALRNILGYSLEELQKLGMADITHPDDLAQDAASFKELLEGKCGQYRIEKRYIHKRGHTVWADASVCLVRDADGSPLYCIGVIEDITERTLAEEAMLRSAEHFKALIEHAGDAIYMIDETSRRILDCNQQACDTLGYSREEILKLTTDDVEMALDRNQVNEIHSGLRDTGFTTIEGRHKRKDGSIFPVEIRLGRLDSSNPARIIATVRDMTERESIESALRTSEEKYHFLMDNVPIGVSILQQGKIVFANRYIANVTGYSEAEIKTLDPFVLPHQDDREMIRGYSASRVRGEAAPEVYDFRSSHKDGTFRWINRHVVPVTWNEKPAFLILDKDISERKLAEESLRGSEKRLRKAEEVAGLGYWGFNFDTNIVEASEGARLIYGLAGKEWSIPDVQQIPLPEYREMLNKALDGLVKRGEPYNVEFKIRRAADGRILDIHSIVEFDAEKNEVFGVIQNITSSKQAEQALQESEKHFRTLIDHAGDAIYTVDTLSRRVLDCNRQACETLGYSREEILSLTIDDIETLQDANEIQDSLMSLKKQPFVNVEGRHKRKDGTTFPVEVRLARLDVSDSKAVIAIARDITQRKRAEDELRASEEKYRSLFNNAEVGMFKTRADGSQILDMNQKYTEIFGYTREEMLGTPSASYWTYPEEREEMARRVTAQGSVTDFECHMTNKMGEVRNCLTSVRVYPETGILEGSITDVTGRKRAETALRESEERFRRTFDQSPIGIAMAGLDFKFTRVNKTMCRMLGYSEEELMALTFKDITHPDDLAQDVFEVQRLTAGEIERFEREKRYIRKDGTVFWGHLSIGVIKDEKGLPQYYTPLIVDITQRKQAEEALRVSELGYKSLFENMLHGVAHCKMIYKNGRPEDFIYLSVNPAFERQTGLKKALGKKVSELIPGILETNPELLSIYGRVVSTGVPESFEDYVEPLKIWFYVTVYSPQRGEFVAVFDNITERKRAEAEILRLNRLYAVISQVNQAVVHAKTQEQFLETVCRVITEHGGFKLAWIGKIDEASKRIMPVAAEGEAKDYVNGIVVYADDRPEGRGPTGTSVRELRPVVQNDFLNDPNTQPWHARAQKFGFRGSAAFPILLDGQAWGVIMVYSDTVGYFGAREKGLLEEAAGDIGFALQNFKKEKLRLWAEEALHKGSQELSLLYEASRELSRSLDLKEICRTLLEFISRAMTFDTVTISSFDASDGLISCLYAFDKDLKEIDSSRYPPLKLEPEETGTQSAVIRSDASLLIDDFETYFLKASKHYYVNASGNLTDSLPPDAERSRSAILVPLKSEDRVIGVIQVLSKRLNAFTAEHLRLVEALSVHAAASITNALLYSRVQKELAEREEAEEALQQSEKRFRSLYEDSTVGIYRTTPDGRILLANPALVSMLGYSSFDELASKNLDDASFEPSYPRQMFLDKIEASGEIKGLESSWKRRDGSVIYVRESARAIRDIQGKTLYYDGIVEDITERKQVEEALLESEEKFRNLADQSPNIIFIHSGKKIVYVNRKGVQMMGYSEKELYSPEFNFLSLIAPEFQERMRSSFIEHMQGNETPTLECTVVTKDGNHIEVILATKLIDYEGQRAILGTITDNSENKKTQEERRHLEEKAQVASRLAAVGEMAAGIAHEINNPLTSVIGFSELLMEQELPPDVMEEVKIIADGSRRVADIVKRLLTFARQNKPIRTALNINALIDNTLKLRTYVLQTANITVYTCYDQDLPWIAADPGQMQQVFLNLIVNAEQAMKSAHNGGELRISTERRDQRIRIVFQDNGPGISKENLGRLFQPFFTTKAPGEGTGLGLSLSRSIVIEHGGEMWAESQPGHGATFIVELPLSEAPASPKDAASTPAAAPATPASTTRILVVDDEPSIQDYLRVALTAAGYTVDCTGDPEEALNIVTDNSYGVILLDIRMPGMSGTELFGRIMQKFPALARKVIFMTGDTSDAGVKAFLARNNLPFLSKPFEVKALEDKVRACLEAD